MNQYVTDFLLFLNAFFQGFAQPDWASFGLVFFCWAALAGILAFPLLKAHFLTVIKKSDPENLAPVFGKSMSWLFWSGMGLWVGCTATLLGSGGMAACGATSTATTHSRNTAFARIINSDIYPWRDLCAQPASALSGVALAPSGAVASVETISLLYGLFALLLSFASFILHYSSKNPRERNPKRLQYWGHYASPAKNDTSTGPAPWLKNTGSWLAWLLLAAWLSATQYLPVFAAAGEAMIPMMVWSWVGVLWVLFVCLLRCGGTAPKEAEPKQPLKQPKAPPKVTRVEWERFMNEQGFVLLRGESGSEVPVSAPAKPSLDAPNLNARRSNEFRYSSSTTSTRGATALGAGRRAKEELKVTGDKMYGHQGVFVQAVTGQPEQGHRSRAYLMHTDRCSGRTSAVFQAALLQSINGYGSMLLYPSAGEAQKAFEESFYRPATQNRFPHKDRVILLESFADQIEPDSVVVASVDWLVDEYLPSFQGRAVDHAPLRDFSRNLKLVVLEDIERLSGVRATNVVLVMRRLYRLLRAFESEPVLGLTACANPSGASGVNEFAQRLCGPLDLVSVAERCDAPSHAIHGYVLSAAPTTPADAQGLDPLPAMAQCALVSRAFTPHTRLDEDLDTVRRHDLIPPNWVIELAKKRGNHKDDFNREQPFYNHILKSWVRLEQVNVEEALSLDERIRIGGTSSDLSKDFEHVHLVVMHPQFHDRGVVNFMLSRFLSHREHQPEQHTRWRQLRRMGSRLVNGEPSKALLKKHLMVAMLEHPGTESEFEDLLPDPELLHTCIEELMQATALAKKDVRALSDSNPPTLIKRHVLVPQLEETPRTPLDTITMFDVQLRLVGNSRVLRSVDLEHALRATYPGMLFTSGKQRYRAIEDRYPEFHERWKTFNNTPRDSRSGISRSLWIACDRDDSVAFTSPIFSRVVSADEDPSMPPSIEKTTNENGQPTIRWRGRATVKETFFGRLECTQKPDGTVKWTKHQWLKGRLESTNPMETLVVALPGQTISVAGCATLRRMMVSALKALIQIEEHAIGVHVTPALGDLRPDFGENKEMVGDPGAIMLLAPYNGEAGLIDSMGASPWRFVNNLFQFVCLWCRHLNEQQTVAWEDIGYVGTLEGDDDLAPAPQEVLECVEALLGTWIPENVTDSHTQIDAPVELPLLRTDAPKGGTNGKYSEHYTSELREQVSLILGECPTEPTVEQLFRVFDWMHRYIRYEHDDEQYGTPDYIATPAETLQSLKGDCEDHALLLGSLLMSMGLHVRTVLLPEHALCQLYLGKTGEVDLTELAALLKQLRADQAAAWGIDASKRPYIKGELAEGWTQSGEAYEHANEYIVYDNAWSELAVEEHDGELWLVLDTAMSGCYPGDPGGLATDDPQSGTTVQWAEGAWVQGAAYQYPPKLA